MYWRPVVFPTYAGMKRDFVSTYVSGGNSFVSPSYTSLPRNRRIPADDEHQVEDAGRAKVRTPFEQGRPR